MLFYAKAKSTRRCRRNGVRASWRARRGSAILELAVLLPVLTLLIIGVLDWGFVLFRYQHMLQAAREGVRVRAAEGPAFPTSTAKAATEAYLLRVYPELAGSFNVTTSGPGSTKAFMQVQIPYSKASITGSSLAVPGGDLTVRVEIDYLTAVAP